MSGSTSPGLGPIAVTQAAEASRTAATAPANPSSMWSRRPSPTSVNIQTIVLGNILAITPGDTLQLVIIGGVKSIGQVASAFVPLMIVLYILGACWVLVANAEAIPGAFGLIFTEAFTGSAGVGGAAGSALFIAIQQGVARGIFSNESGLGTGGIAAAAAQTSQPVRQALVSMTQTFIDTLVVVTFTGLVVVVSGAYKLVTPGDYDTSLNGEALTREAFSKGMPGDWGGIIVGLGLIFFAFTTLLGWSYYGERCVERLTGGRTPLYIYKFVFIVLIFVGTIANLEHIITFSDLMNGLMALPNLVGLLLLSPLVYRETRKFFQRPDWKLMDPVEPATIDKP